MLENFSFWLQSKRYSSNTTRTYTEAFRTFLRHTAGKSISAITTEDIIQFNNHYILKKRN
ncbi:MAG: phage integrase N-terminal SAM-like domain-containing protein [Cyclobacteriaceae bacterium]|nr:phage integrase N-terminal SAM-like domain-containing protein [Cyclobacteriaceae bacterium]